MPLAKRRLSDQARRMLGPLLLAGTCWLAGCVATAEIRFPSANASNPERVTESGAVLARLEADAARLSDEAERIESRYARDIQPVASILAASPFAAPENEALRRRIALALDREARGRGLSAQLLASVLIVENPWLDLDRRSSVGAVGLMQVMPFHAGKWGCASSDLEDVDVNICHGARILARDLRRSRGDTDRALLRYNGCVRGTNTPDCRSYPTKVYAQAGKARLFGPVRPAVPFRGAEAQAGGRADGPAEGLASGQTPGKTSGQASGQASSG